MGPGTEGLQRGAPSETRWRARAPIVVAVGASMGGLAACKALLANLPPNLGMCVLIVQHLDPDHGGMLASLLSLGAGVAVSEAVHGELLAPDHAYVIPPGFTLALVERRVALTPRPRGAEAGQPFDAVLATVAACGLPAAAVVLSGMGNDGAVGVAAVAVAGGLAIAQDPEEAGAPGMPKSAIAGGHVHAVLRVGDIAAALARFAQGEPRPACIDPVAYFSAAPGAHIADAAFAEIVALLNEGAGYDFRSYKPGTLRRRILYHMATAAPPVATVAAFIARLATHPEERDALARDLLIHVTSFFRDESVYETLRTSVLPALLRTRRDGEPLRVWVAGCSTGEELYSLGVVALEAIRASGRDIRLQMFGTDLDPDCIAVSRAAVYPASIATQVSAERLAAFFVIDAGGYRVGAALRDVVTLAVQDVLRDPPFSRMDLISCRNLLIYFATPAQDRAIAFFHFALRPGGVLLLGASETIGKAQDSFEVVSKTDRIYRRVGASQNAGLPVAFRVDAGGRAAAIVPAPARRAAASAERSANILLGRYAPPTVLTTRQLSALHFFGPSSWMLAPPQGPLTADLVAMVHRPLRTALRAAAHRALTEGRRASVETRAGEGGAPVRIDVEPIDDDDETKLLVSFVEIGPPGLASSHALILAPSPSSTVDEAGAPAEIERELLATRRELQAAVAGLERANDDQKALNEETLSINEEFQTANEELLASKEELQSLNEELTVLNAQLHEALDRQHETSDDLTNILFSTDVPTLFLDAALNIRFFTPRAKDLFHVRDSDVGRRLSEIVSSLRDPWLFDDARAVIATREAIEREVRGDEVWLTRRAMPYRTHDGRVEGVVVTYVDITLRKQANVALEAARQAADSASDAKSRFLSSASHELRQPLQTLVLLQWMLMAEPSGDAVKALLKRVGGTLAAMTGMLDALLDVNRIESGVMRNELSPTPLSRLFADLEESFAYRADAAGVRLRVAPTTRVVMSDARLLEQMLRHLLSNALKFTRGGKVLLGCRLHGDQVVIEIWDDGVGVAPEHLDQIFDDYYQIEPSAARGVGLGLPIVKRLGDLLGHRVSVSSAAGRGSVFRIAVGLAPSAAAPALAARRPNAPTRASVLIVEDDDDVRVLLQQVFATSGFTAATARGGDAALALLAEAERGPDILIVDYNLPGGRDGVAVAEGVRAQFPDVGVLFLTGDMSAQALSRLADQRGRLFAKPARPDLLVAAAREFLAQAPPVAQAAPEVAAPAPFGERAGGEIVMVVEDDAASLAAYGEVLARAGFRVLRFASAEDAFAADVGEVGCLVVDAALPGVSGLDLIRRRRQAGQKAPAIVVTGRGDVTLAVEAMKIGVVDFLLKPLAAADLITAVARAVSLSGDADARSQEEREALAKIATLTRRQREIMTLVVSGSPSKVIAFELGLSQRTVENHRAAIMRKLGVRSLPALARMAFALSDAH